MIQKNGFALLEVVLSLLFAAFFSVALGKALWQQSKHFSRIQSIFHNDSRKISEWIGGSLNSSCVRVQEGKLLLLHCTQKQDKRILTLNLFLDAQ